MNVTSRPWIDVKTGASKAAAIVTLVACGAALGPGTMSYGGQVGLSGIQFNVSQYGRYYVTLHFTGTITYAVSANLTGPVNATSPPSASVSMLAGLRIRDASNSSWDLSGGSWNEHAKSCGTHYGWYCPLVRASVPTSTSNSTNATVPISWNLTWWSGPYKKLVPGDTYEIGTVVLFGLQTASSTVASGSTLSASLSFHLHYTQLIVRGPF